MYVQVVYVSNILTSGVLWRLENTVGIFKKMQKNPRPRAPLRWNSEHATADIRCLKSGALARTVSCVTNRKNYVLNLAVVEEQGERPLAKRPTNWWEAYVPEN